MRKVILTRFESSDQGTFGMLDFAGNTAFTLELPWRDNIKCISCIPQEKYTCKIVKSPKFGKVYGVMGVEGRGNILIHSANLAGDIELGYATQLQGCIAPCNKLGNLLNKFGKIQKAGLISRPALNRLMSWADGYDFELEIKCSHL